MTSSTSDIALIGAGIGGLTAALGLLRAGLDVTVHEQARKLQDVGAGVQLSANATRVLRHLGVEPALTAVSGAPVAKEIRLWNTGESWSVADTGADSVQRYGAPFLMLHRHDLQQVLVDAVRAIKPDAIRLGARCAQVSQDGAGARAVFEDGHVARAACLVGADGIHSAVRSGLFGAQSPQFTGCIAWRGIIPVERLPRDARTGLAANWIGPRRHVITYPLRKGALLNFVGIVRGEWTEESWTAEGSKQEFRDAFAGWHPDVQAMVEAIEPPYKWALMSRAPMQRWSVGRISLLGDACHPTLPFLGSGAGMAIEDGAVLARCLAAWQDPQQALARYQAARIARTTSIVERSAAMLDVFQTDRLRDADEAGRYVATEWAADKVRQRYDWLYAYDPLTVEI